MDVLSEFVRAYVRYLERGGASGEFLSALPASFGEWLGDGGGLLLAGQCEALHSCPLGGSCVRTCLGGGVGSVGSGSGAAGGGKPGDESSAGGGAGTGLREGKVSDLVLHADGVPGCVGVGCGSNPRGPRYELNRRSRLRKARSKANKGSSAVSATEVLGGTTVSNPVGFRDVATKEQLEELAVQRCELYSLENARRILVAKRRIAEETVVAEAGIAVVRTNNWISRVRKGAVGTLGTNSMSTDSGANRTQWSGASAGAGSWRATSVTDGTRVSVLETQLGLSEVKLASSEAKVVALGAKVKHQEKELREFKKKNKYDYDGDMRVY